MPMIYLAAPYMHPDLLVREARVREVDACAAALMQDGHIVFSPLSMNHRVKDHCGLHEAPHEFWMQQDLPWMTACDKLVVLCLDGWKESKGVAMEIQWAQFQLRIPIDFIQPRTNDEQRSGTGNSDSFNQDPGESSAEGVPSGPVNGIVKLH